MDGAKGYSIRLRTEEGIVNEANMPQPDDGVRPRIVFPDLVPGKAGFEIHTLYDNIQKFLGIKGSCDVFLPIRGNIVN